MQKIRVLAAPGPVSYPLIAAKSNILELTFGKEGTGEIVLDSTISLIRRNIPFNVSLIGKLFLVYPFLGETIGVWRKGSVGDLLTRIAIDLEARNSRILYGETQQEVMQLLKTGKTDSAVITSSFGDGVPFESIFKKHGLSMPGNCAAFVSDEYMDVFKEEYERGVNEIRSNPETSSKYISSVLPIKIEPSFISSVILKSEVMVRRVTDSNKFIDLASSYVN